MAKPSREGASTPQGQNRTLSFAQALAIVVGMIIGSGIFLKPSIVLEQAGSPVGSLLAWVAGGLITLAAALSVAEVASAIPKTGGLYTYLQDLYGDVWGYLLGWVQTIISYPASIAAQAIAFATYAAIFWPMTGGQQKVVAIAVMAFLLAMNILSTQYGGVIQTLSTVGKLIPVAAIIGFGVFSTLVPDFTQAGGGLSATGFGAAILSTLWAYDGWIGVTNMAGELKNPGLQDLYGDVWGYLLGWVQTIISYPASIAAQAIAFATYAAIFWPMTGGQQKVVAIAVMAFLLAMNILSTQYGGVIQTLSTVGKLIPVAAIIGFGVFSTLVPDFTQAGGGLSATGFGAAILSTLWAYDGWIGVTNMAGELKNPGKNLPKVIALGVSFVVLVYALFNLAIFKVLPYETVVASATPGAEAAVALFGQGGATFITIGIMVSVFGALNGYLMTAARVPLAMGKQDKLPFSRVLGKLHPKFQTPCNALILQCVLAAAYILSGSFNTLTDLLIFVLWIFFAMGVFGVFLLRKKHPDKKGPYRVPLYPLTPIVGVLGAAYILGSTILSSPGQSLVGIGLTLIGLPVYYYKKKQSR